MTAPQAKTEMRFTEERQELLEDILREMEQRARDATPETLVGLTLRGAKETADLFRALQEASIRLTYPEDWVRFKARDGAEVCFLQDSGCNRIRPLWQIDFEDVRLRDDMQDRELEDGHYVAEIIVRGKSSLTGESVEEMGFRSTSGFFGPEWTKVHEDEKPVEIERMKANVRKAALANGRGRCVRTVSGTSQVPIVKLKEFFGEAALIRVRATEFQAGTKGGSGSYASDPQIKMICAEALKKVAGLDQAFKFGELMEKVRSANLSGGRGGKASKLIERLQAAESKDITIAQFEQALGIQLVEHGDEE